MGNRIVLCVDDEETILNSLEMDLSDPDGGYQVELATNGMEALDLVNALFEEGHELAVVISDYIMPEMKGDELLGKIHQDYPSAVNILLTGQS
ncbi:MAG: response regulator, partial [Candidatus Marinimicrobia bacterium]|nr:response regulator [Candidatus Neomarinimicrobiota bacterium]